MFDEVEKQDLKKAFDEIINYHVAAADEAERVGDIQFKKIHERKAKTFLKAIGELLKNPQEG